MAGRIPHVHIIGAGLSGLTLGLCLKHKGIPATIYDKAASAARHGYGITLKPSTYRPLLKLLDLDEHAFRGRLAVDAQRGGTGRMLSQDPDANPSIELEEWRCHRGRLEALLRKDLSIKWSSSLTSVRVDQESKGVTASLEDGSKVDTSCLVGCDGPHSIVRQSLAPSMELEVLPYAVYNGKERLLRENSNSPLWTLKDSTKRQVHHKIPHHGYAVLELSMNDITPSHMDLSWVYSRKAQPPNDPLFKPDRPNSGARDIPDEFWAEMDCITCQDMQFGSIFNDGDKMNKSRMLNWLMRIVEPVQSEAERLAQNGVILIGDAVHATPILGGNGANDAIRDGIELAEFIAENGVEQLELFSRKNFDRWQKAVDEGKKGIAAMHEVGAFSIISRL